MELVTFGFVGIYVLERAFVVSLSDFETVQKFTLIKRRNVQEAKGVTEDDFVSSKNWVVGIGRRKPQV